MVLSLKMVKAIMPATINDITSKSGNRNFLMTQSFFAKFDGC